MIFNTTSKLYNLRSYCVAVQFLGMNLNDYKNFILKKKLQDISTSQLHRSEKYFKEAGYTNEELIENAALFKQPFHIWDQRITTLKEGGFTNISLSKILKYRTLVNNSVATLKRNGYIPMETIVPKAFLSHLGSDLCEIDIGDLIETLTFSKIHRSILTRYLVNKFEVHEDKVISLFRVHGRLRLKSLNYLCSNIKFALSIGYSMEKILNNIYIICTCPKNTEEVIKELPQLLSDVNIKYEMFVYPKLIGIPFDNFVTIYTTLKKHGIKDEAIRKSMNIFTLSTETVEKRLQGIQRDAEMRIFLTDPYILKLVVHYNRAKYRLNLLHEYKMKCATMTILETGVSGFDDHIKDGKDVNYDQAVYRFINRLLKCNVPEIRRKLRQHPYYNHVPFIAIQDSYRYLKSLQFSEIDLQEVVQLLLYPRSKIKDGYSKCKKYCDKEGITNIDNIQILNLTLYFIEKDHHFTGNGIWINNEENMA